MQSPVDLRYASSTLARSIAPALLALAVGAFGAYAALGLVAMIAWVQSIALGIEDTHVYTAAADLPALRVVLVPCLGGVIVGLLVHWLVPGRRDHGPADVMASVRDDDIKLSLRASVASAATAAIAIGCGASLGRYAPSVHLGASVAAAISRVFKLVRAERLTLIGCGVAAAISASFSAPLAGILFAHEVVLDAFARRGFVAITIASVTGHAVARVHDVSFSLASLEQHRVGFTHEFLLFAVIGVIGGLVAIVFIKGLSLSGRIADRIPLPNWLKPALAGALVGIVALRYPQVLGLGDEAIHDAIEAQFAPSLLIALLAAKLVLVCCCRGLGVPGGVVGPSLFLGAMLGAATGQLIASFDPALVSSAPVYALAGMGALISCVIGAPLTTILIVFEITGSYALATAVMVSVVVASMVAGRLFPYSLFNLQLKERGVDIRLGREVRIMRSRRVADVVSEDFQYVNANTPVSEAKALLQDLQIGEVLVLGEDGVLVGQASLIQLLAASESDGASRPVGDIAAMPATVFDSEENLDRVMQQLRYFAGLSIPVVNNHASMKVVGVVFQSSIIGAYNDAVEQARSEERGSD